MFDKDENGLISENDIRTIFTTLGENVTTDDINHLLEQAHLDEAGRVKYADFVKIILKGVQ